MADTEFLTVAEVAAILKLNEQTVRNWIDAGTLPALRVGRRVRIKREDFNAIVEAGATGSAAPQPREPEPTAEDFWLGNLAIGAPVFERGESGT